MFRPFCYLNVLLHLFLATGALVFNYAWDPGGNPGRGIIIYTGFLSGHALLLQLVLRFGIISHKWAKYFFTYIHVHCINIIIIIMTETDNSNDKIPHTKG